MTTTNVATKDQQIKDYTLTVFSENVPGVLSEVVSVFTRIKLNIDSLTVSASTYEGIHRFTVVTHCSETVVNKIIGQLEKKIDVVAAFHYSVDEIIAREMGLYKVPPDVFNDETFKANIMKEYNPRILEENEDYTVLICTGKTAKVLELYEILKLHDLIEFVRSGRLAVVKPMNPFALRLQELDLDFV